MIYFSAVQVELSYLIAKADYTKLQIEKARNKKQSTKELKEKLNLTQNLIRQLEIRLHATIE